MTRLSMEMLRRKIRRQHNRDSKDREGQTLERLLAVLLAVWCDTLAQYHQRQLHCLIDGHPSQN